MGVTTQRQRNRRFQVSVVTKIYPYTAYPFPFPLCGVCGNITPIYSKKLYNFTNEAQNYKPQDNSSSNGTVAHGCRQ